MAPNSKAASGEYILDAMSQTASILSEKSLSSSIKSFGSSISDDDSSSDDSEWSEDEEELDDTDCASDGRSGAGRVSFAKTKKKFTTLDLDHFTEEEFRSCWYSSKEKKANADARDKLIARMEAGKRCKRDMTYRGLEAWTEAGSQRLVDRVTLYIDTVMDEQDAQWDRKEEDALKIAKVGLKVSSKSVQEALTKATADHEEALRCLDDAKSCSSESYDDDDFSVATVDLAEMRRRRNNDGTNRLASTWGGSDPPGKEDDETASTSDMTEVRRRRKRGGPEQPKDAARHVADYRHDPPGTLDADVSKKYSTSLMTDMQDATRMTIDGVKKPKKKKTKKTSSKKSSKSKRRSSKKEDGKPKKDKKKKARRKSESSASSGEFELLRSPSFKEKEKLSSISEHENSSEKQKKRNSNLESPRVKTKDKISPKSPGEKPKRRSSINPDAPKSPSPQKSGSSQDLSNPPESAKKSKKKVIKRKSSKISVSFNEIEVRYYDRIPDLNPAVTSGVAIGFGWEYEKGGTMPVTQWEEQKEEGREAHELVLSRPERESLLKELGFSQKEIAEATRNILKTKNQRKTTVQNLQHQSMEEAAEKAARKMKGFLFRRR